MSRILLKLSKVREYTIKCYLLLESFSYHESPLHTHQHLKYMTNLSTPPKFCCKYNFSLQILW